VVRAALTGGSLHSLLTENQLSGIWKGTLDREIARHDPSWSVPNHDQA
jgi:hypothetical protein